MFEERDNDHTTSNQGSTCQDITTITVLQDGISKTLNIVSVKDVRDTIKYSFDFASLDKTVHKGALKNPFDTYIHNGAEQQRFMALPKNYQSFKTNIYFQSIIAVAEAHNYRFVTTDIDFHATITLPDKKMTDFLTGYVAVAKTKSLPEKSVFKDRGYGYKGMLEATHHWFEANKINRKLLKPSTMSLNSTLIKDKIANKIESKILDTIISIWKTHCGDIPDNINLMTMSSQEINIAFGLSFDTKSNAIMDYEEDTIKALLEVAKINPKYNQGDFNNINKDNYASMLNAVSNRQSEIKYVKSIFSNTIERRLNSVYHSYKNKKQYAGKQLKELIDRDIKGTRAYTAFNPTTWLKIISQTPLPDESLYSPFGENEEQFVEYMDTMFQPLISKVPGFTEVLANNMKSNYKNYISEFFE